ncbi:DUF1735 domain-containing protein [Rufibacter ruber]|uniref:DUF1735 domain-containing protein n=1 Tax=Rufibacter ruber TaxID=1783499 RepID=UPI000832F4F8|nr:DUF1735 domain-containing protein [Rufibacter ruber]
MKKLKLSLLLSMLALALAACDDYEEYIKDNEFTAVYFGTQKPLRTIVAYDEMKFKVGVTLAGRRENKQDEWATFEVDPSLLTNTSFKLLPKEYYTLSDENRMVIPAGKFIGDVTVTLNKAAFTSDPLAHTNTYALPLRLKETSVDSILLGKLDLDGGVLTPAKDYTVLVVKYISPLHGVYYHKGTQRKLDNAGNVTEETVYSTTDLSKNQTWNLTTLALNEVETSGAGTFVTTTVNNVKNSFGLKLFRNADNTVTIEKAAGSKVTILQSSGTYDATKREFNLEYRFTANGSTYSVTDQLILRQAPELDLRFEEWQ